MIKLKDEDLDKIHQALRHARNVIRREAGTSTAIDQELTTAIEICDRLYGEEL